MTINQTDVEQLTDMACRIDEIKNFFPDGQREALAGVVDQLHQVAGEADSANRFGIYPGVTK